MEFCVWDARATILPGNPIFLHSRGILPFQFLVHNDIGFSSRLSLYSAQVGIEKYNTQRECATKDEISYRSLPTFEWKLCEKVSSPSSLVHSSVCHRTTCIDILYRRASTAAKDLLNRRLSAVCLGESSCEICTSGVWKSGRRLFIKG
jgi:hypothetical protein